MSDFNQTDLEQHRDALREEVYALLQEAEGELKAHLEETGSPREAGLDACLKDVFSRNATGKKEALRMELDVLRRLSRSDASEQIFRPYGILEIVTPVRMSGRTCHAICSGPLLVEAWTAPAKETLAKFCGLRVQDLPQELEKASLHTPEQIRAIQQGQEQCARWIAQKGTSQGSAPNTAVESDAGAMDLLQPGFADHLDVLFGLIQQASPKGRSIPEDEAGRIHKIADRGRKLTEHARRLRNQGLQDPQPQSVHAILASWCSKLEVRFPHLRIRTRLEAAEEMVVANPQQLHHLVYTLLCGIVDGLPEGRALLGVSTRNEDRPDGKMLHVEIRDGGGLATFAGVGGELDQQLQQEQSQLTDESSEWTVLASRLNAEIRILRDADAVTRAEVFLPLAGGSDGDVMATGAQHLWIVEDEDSEVENLLRMVERMPVSCTRFRSAAELKEKFATASTAPDIVLLKYYLPDERGADVRSWLYEQDSSLPVILISSLDATHPGIATVNKLPSTLYLQKPFEASALLDMIHLNLDDTLAG